MSKQDLVIIGGGVGGLVTCSVAAQLGIKVTLIEKQSQLGGDCLHFGCVPSKTLVHAAKIAALMRRGQEFGLSSVDPHVDLAKINQHVADVIADIQKHDNPERFRSYGAQVLFGAAKFINPHQLEVNGETISGKRFLISTGSHPFIPPVTGLRETPYLTNETIFNLKELPKHLIVLGAGVIGIEIAQCFARFGSQVTIIEMFDKILPPVDPEISRKLQQVLHAEGIKFNLATQAKSISNSNDNKQVICQTQDGATFTIEGDEILVATGQAPNVQHLNLEAAGVNYSPRGITVDKRLRTSVKHIYAVGDVLDLPFKLTHLAEHQAGIIISNAVFRIPKKVNYQIVPAVIFSDPEIAMVGMNEAQAQAAGITPSVLRFDFKDVDRAILERETHGLTKLLVHKNKIIGATIMGPHAGELIAEIVLAMQAKINIRKIADAIHAYPTLSQVNRRTINTYYSDKLFSPLARRIVKWMNKVVP